MGLQSHFPISELPLNDEEQAELAPITQFLQTIAARPQLAEQYADKVAEANARAAEIQTQAEQRGLVVLEAYLARGLAQADQALAMAQRELTAFKSGDQEDPFNDPALTVEMSTEPESVEQMRERICTELEQRLNERLLNALLQKVNHPWLRRRLNTTMRNVRERSSHIPSYDDRRKVENALNRYAQQLDLHQIFNRWDGKKPLDKVRAIAKGIQIPTDLDRELDSRALAAISTFNKDAEDFILGVEVPTRTLVHSRAERIRAILEGVEEQDQRDILAWIEENFLAKRANVLRKEYAGPISWAATKDLTSPAGFSPSESNQVLPRAYNAILAELLKLEEWTDLVPKTTENNQYQDRSLEAKMEIVILRQTLAELAEGQSQLNPVQRGDDQFSKKHIAYALRQSGDGQVYYAIIRRRGDEISSDSHLPSLQVDDRETQISINPDPEHTAELTAALVHLNGGSRRDPISIPYFQRQLYPGTFNGERRRSEARLALSSSAPSSAEAATSFTEAMGQTRLDLTRDNLSQRAADVLAGAPLITVSTHTEAREVVTAIQTRAKELVLAAEQRADEATGGLAAIQAQLQTVTGERGSAEAAAEDAAGQVTSLSAQVASLNSTIQGLEAGLREKDKKIRGKEALAQEMSTRISDSARDLEAIAAGLRAASGMFQGAKREALMTELDALVGKLTAPIVVKSD